MKNALKALLLALLFLPVLAFAAVSHDAEMTGGNGAGGNGAPAGADFHGTAASLSSSTAITIGASATLLIVDISNLNSGGSTTGLGCTWNGVSMTQAVIETNGNISTSIYVLVNPATGAKTLACTFPSSGSNAWYVHASSFTGTDTTTGYKSADNVTSTSTPITINTTANDATFASYSCDGGGSGAASNFQITYDDVANTQNGSGSYEIGGAGTNSHAFTCTGGTEAGVGIHIIAPTSGGPRASQFFFGM